MVWLNIYKRSFCLDNQLDFKTGIYFEDNEFTPRALYLAQDVCVTSSPFYYYRIRSGSLAQQMFDGKKLEDSVFVANSLLDFSNYRVKEKRMKSYFANKEQEREINLLLRRVSLLANLPFHFRSMLLFHRITLRGMLYVVKKRYKYKYFQS